MSSVKGVNMKFSREEMSLLKLVGMKDQIKFETKFQRGSTWKPKDKQYFMDTIRREWRTSKLFLWKRTSNEYVCVDGLQRLNTVFDFVTKNGFSFSKASGEFSGKKFKDLDVGERSRIEKYIFDVELISDASPNDVADFFIRLQMGVPLNPAEKLNALLGDVRDFVCEVSQHRFFTDTIPARDHRFSHRYLSAQIVLLVKSGLHSLKSRDLREMYEDSIDNEVLETVKSRLDYLTKTFPRKAPELGNRATIMSMFYFVNTEFVNLSLAGKGDILRRFLKEFQKELKRQRKLEEDERDPELQTYLLNVVQAADTAAAIGERHKILLRRFSKFENEGKI
jgi:hypothetical protein